MFLFFFFTLFSFFFFEKKVHPATMPQCHNAMQPHTHFLFSVNYGFTGIRLRNSPKHFSDIPPEENCERFYLLENEHRKMKGVEIFLLFARKKCSRILKEYFGKYYLLAKGDRIECLLISFKVNLYILFLEFF